MKKEPLLEPLQQEMASLRLRPLKIVEEKNVIRVVGAIEAGRFQDRLRCTPRPRCNSLDVGYRVTAHQPFPAS